MHIIAGVTGGHPGVAFFRYCWRLSEDCTAGRFSDSFHESEPWEVVSCGETHSRVNCRCLTLGDSVNRCLYIKNRSDRCPVLLCFPILPGKKKTNFRDHSSNKNNQCWLKIRQFQAESQ